MAFSLLLHIRACPASHSVAPPLSYSMHDDHDADDKPVEAKVAPLSLLLHFHACLASHSGAPALSYTMHDDHDAHALDDERVEAQVMPSAFCSPSRPCLAPTVLPQPCPTP